MEFNSQICTTREQSERLLALGLKKETADCRHWAYTKDSKGNSIPKSNQKWFTRMGTNESIQVCGLMNVVFIPAWSLHRLIDLCGIDRLPICFGKKGKVRIRVSHIHPTHDGRSGYNHYDSLIDCIEWLIKENYFNKEYLEE
jgi:hypothetical protein